MLHALSHTASGAVVADEGCTSQATIAAGSAAVADARCIGQAMKAASNAMFVDEVCTTQTRIVEGVNSINPGVSYSSLPRVQVSKIFK